MQISYLSLLTIKEINPCFKALTNIWFINGFNYYALTKNYLMDALSPIKIKGIFLYSQFFQNYNFTFILVLIPMTVALGFLILSKTVFKAERKKMVKMGKLFMG